VESCHAQLNCDVSLRLVTAHIYVQCADTFHRQWGHGLMMHPVQHEAVE
jgi:hypothetical protein